MKRKHVRCMIYFMCVLGFVGMFLFIVQKLSACQYEIGLSEVNHKSKVLT